MNDTIKQHRRIFLPIVSIREFAHLSLSIWHLFFSSDSRTKTFASRSLHFTSILVSDSISSASTGSVDAFTLSCLIHIFFMLTLLIVLLFSYSSLTAIFFSEDPKYFEQAKVLLLTSVQDALQQSPIDAKMTYRLAVITGTLVYSDANATELARDLDVLSVLETAAKDEKCRQDQPTQQVKSELTKAITGK